MARIIVLGSLNMDLVLTVPRLPQAGETALGKRLFGVDLSSFAKV